MSWRLERRRQELGRGQIVQSRSKIPTQPPETA